jgi:cysteinyl-tRNA synthetase
MGDWAAPVDLAAVEAAFGRIRDKAMETKDFSELDALKLQLAEAGVEVRMSREGVSLTPAAGFDPAKLEGLV